MTRRKRQPFRIGPISVMPGRKAEAELPVARMITGSPLSIPMMVLHGPGEGPAIWVNAAIHGDEINGVEIIRQLLERIDHRSLQGTLVAIPVVNVPGFMNGSRYLPDRRDLNRSFPGSPRGSMASRIAALFTEEILSQCQFGVDLHTGSDRRTNLPQIRANLDDPTNRKLAEAFAPPVLLHSPDRTGSLRQVAAQLGVNVLLFEGGEAGRFDEHSIEVGVHGIRRVMAELGMIPDPGPRPDPPSAAASDDRAFVPDQPVRCRDSRWVRARRTGIAHLEVGLGATVSRGQVIGRIHDSFGHRLGRMTASTDGIIIGLNLDPIVNQGDAMAHIGQPTAGNRWADS